MGGQKDFWVGCGLGLFGDLRRVPGWGSGDVWLCVAGALSLEPA